MNRIEHLEPERTLQRIESAGTLTTEDIDALNALSEPLIFGNDPRRLLESSQRTCDLARRLSYAKGEAYGLTYMGFARWFLGEFEEARDDLKAAQALFEAIGDSLGLAKARVALLSVQKSLGAGQRAGQESTNSFRAGSG